MIDAHKISMKLSTPDKIYLQFVSFLVVMERNCNFGFEYDYFCHFSLITGLICNLSLYLQ